jgi:hypothetical protein
MVIELTVSVNLLFHQDVSCHPEGGSFSEGFSQVQNNMLRVDNLMFTFSLFLISLYKEFVKTRPPNISNMLSAKDFSI